MAKKATAKAETKEETKKEGPAYGVPELVEETGLQPASIRVALRELGVEKEFGNQYGWSNKKDFDAVVKALNERSAKRKDRAAAAETAEKATKAKAPAKGTAKKAAKAK
jgi:hypothetical protein